MTTPNFSVLPNKSVWIALATTKTGCQITQIKVWLKTVEVLTDSVAFINDNDLLPEIFTRAGAANTDYFNLIVEEASTSEGPYFIYELILSHSES